MTKKHNIHLESQLPIRKTSHPPEPSSFWGHLLEGDVWSIVTCMVVFFLMLFAGGVAIYYMSPDVPEVTDKSAASTDDTTWTDLGTGSDPTTNTPGHTGPTFTSAGSNSTFDNCTPKSCETDGTCTNNEGGYTCCYLDIYTGKNCELWVNFGLLTTTGGKAGARRNLGRRPKVRGVAMNACDHPHGGGEGKSKGHNSVSKWGMPTKGYRTRKKTKIHSWMRVERRPPNPKRYKKSVMKNSTKLKD
eukprot:1927_1